MAKNFAFVSASMFRHIKHKHIWNTPKRQTIKLTDMNALNLQNTASGLMHKQLVISSAVFFDFSTFTQLMMRNIIV